MSFYVTLPSNASENVYPDNHAGHFFVKLPQTFDLSQQYEVGLVEVQIPNTYFNVLEGEAWIQYLPGKGKPPALWTVPPGLYASPDLVLNQLNNQVLVMTKGGPVPVRFLWERAANKVSFNLNEEGCEVIISDMLTELLRLPSSHASEVETSVVEGEPGVKMDSDLRNVFVYCDLVASRPVGDVMVPLLRAIPIMDRGSTSVFRVYDKAHYVPLSRFSFDTVEVLLTTDRGKTIPFKRGTSVLTLHFRTRRHLDFE